MQKPEKESSAKSDRAYRVIIKESALKQLSKIPRKFAEKIDNIIQALATEPRPHGSKKLHGYENVYRVRYTDYRVVYSIEDKMLTVDIISIGNRKDVYDTLG